MGLPKYAVLKMLFAPGRRRLLEWADILQTDLNGETLRFSLFAAPNLILNIKGKAIENKMYQYKKNVEQLSS